MQKSLWNFQCSMLTQIFGDYCEFKILICLCLNFRDILRVRVFLGQARQARIGMALKFQTMANKYFEIMMILKNMRTVKSFYPTNLISWTLVKCQIRWLVMTKKLILMEKFEICDYSKVGHWEKVWFQLLLKSVKILLIS